MRLAWINANYDRIEYESVLDLPRHVMLSMPPLVHRTNKKMICLFFTIRFLTEAIYQLRQRVSNNREAVFRKPWRRVPMPWLSQKG